MESRNPHPCDVTVVWDPNTDLDLVKRMQAPAPAHGHVDIDMDSIDMSRIPSEAVASRASRHSKSSPTPCKLLVFVASFKTFEIESVIFEKNLQRLKEVGERFKKKL